MESIGSVVYSFGFVCNFHRFRERRYGLADRVGITQNNGRRSELEPSAMPVQAGCRPVFEYRRGMGGW